MRQGQYRTQSFQIDILLAHLMVVPHGDLTRSVEHCTRFILGHLDDVLTRTIGPCVREVEDGLTTVTDDTRVRVIDERAY